MLHDNNTVVEEQAGNWRNKELQPAVHVIVAAQHGAHTECISSGMCLFRVRACVRVHACVWKKKRGDKG